MSSPVSEATGGFRLSLAGKTILDAVVEVAGINLYDLPSKQFVTTGQAVFDCEQVSVSLLRVQSGMGMSPGAELVSAGPQCDFGWSVIAEVAIVRKYPKMSTRGTISAEKMNGATDQASQDTFILLEAIEKVALDQVGGMSASLTPDQPEGEFYSVTATISMVL